MEKYTLTIRNTVNKRRTDKKIELEIKNQEEKETLIQYLRFIKKISKNTEFILQRTLNF